MWMGRKVSSRKLAARLLQILFPFFLIFYPENTTVENGLVLTNDHRDVYPKNGSKPILGISRGIAEVPHYSTPVSQKIQG